MKYLLISDAASMHIYNFVKNSLMGRGYDIYILRHSIRPIPEQYARFYDENHITVLNAGNETEGNSRLYTIKRFIRKYKHIQSLGHIDICHIHYLHRASLLLLKLFHRRIDKVILSYWGDDILIPSPKEIKMQKESFQYADKITVTVEHSRKVFLERFGNQYNDKLCFGRLTSGAFPAIKEYAAATTKKECRDKMKIPDDKICIVCGYNADPSQHQDKCLEEIAKLSDALKRKIHVLVPIQYDRINMEYIDSVKKAATSSGCSFEILEEYVPFERNATMCLATDIYLNVRDSDAFSNAMKEQIYSGSLMIQGKWLVYEELDEIGASVIKIDNIEQLHEVLNDVVENWKITDSIELFEPLYDIFSISAVRKGWDLIFEELDGEE